MSVLNFDYKKVPRKLFILLWKNRGVFFRLLLCWILGIIFLLFDEAHNYDWRFSLRGQQSHINEIVSINANFDALKNNRKLRSDFAALQTILDHLKPLQPKALILNFSLDEIELTQKQKLQLQTLQYEGALIYRQSNGQIHKDYYPSGRDGLYRHYKKDQQSTALLVGKILSTLKRKSQLQDNSIQLINFRGPQKTFQTFNETLLFSGQVDYFLKNKIILVDLHSEEQADYQTPLGPMSNNELLANILDNELLNRWIKRSDIKLNILFLAFLSALAISVMLIYPQFFSLVIILWMGTAVVSLSIWMFDSFYFWIPILSPTLLLLLIYILFIGYQLSLQENQNWRLEQERKYLLQVEELKNNFVSLISHDLKTPIAKIQAIVDHLKTHQLGDAVEVELDSLRRESAELHRYIQSILKITKVESKDIKLQLEPTDLNKVIKTVIEQLKPLADDKNISIVSQLEPLFLLDLDKTLIFEVILNVLENAIKYSYKEEVIHVYSSEVDDKVLIKIEDHGPGISKDEQQKVFKKFHRGKEHSFHSKGSGLGLYLVKYFVELHGGEVSLESKPNEGTTFQIALPI